MTTLKHSRPREQMDRQHRHCDFCDEFSGGAQNAFAVRYQDSLADRTVLETNSFKVVPSLGQIVQGYLLVIPKTHCCALADLPVESLEELDQLKTLLVSSMGPEYGTCALFEHGARAEGSGGCGISHAHLHVIPLPHAKDPLEKLQTSFPHERISKITGLGAIKPSCSYLYYEDTCGNCHVFYPAFLPSQYMRRIVAESLGVESWDWRESSREESVSVTLRQASRILSGYPVMGTCRK